MFLKTESKLFETILLLGSENVLEKRIVVGKAGKWEETQMV